ncbi:hypothetical protein, partial [Actinobacillus pleuropneumoniae]|uniref:hypothetical protein n=1 Tax=Actinobacillus pleuropneumoniae TaxID=715 RepID=UPI00227D5973
VWVCNTVDKETGFDMNKVKEMFMEEKRSFVDEGASTSRTQSMGKPVDTNAAQESDPSLLASF